MLFLLWGFKKTVVLVGGAHRCCSFDKSKMFLSVWDLKRKEKKNFMSYLNVANKHGIFRK